MKNGRSGMIGVRQKGSQMLTPGPTRMAVKSGTQTEVYKAFDQIPPGSSNYKPVSLSVWCDQ